MCQGTIRRRLQTSQEVPRGLLVLVGEEEPQSVVEVRKCIRAGLDVGDVGAGVGAEVLGGSECGCEGGFEAEARGGGEG